jgi:hypothetical protein
VQKVRKSGTGSKKSHRHFATLSQWVKSILEIKHTLLLTGGLALSNS